MVSFYRIYFLNRKGSVVEWDKANTLEEARVIIQNAFETNYYKAAVKASIDKITEEPIEEVYKDETQ